MSDPLRVLEHPVRRVFLLKAAVVGALLAGLLLSPRLWLHRRSFPLAPVWEHLTFLPPAWDIAVFSLLIAALLATLCTSHPRPYMVAALVMLAGLAFHDTMRWQPWAYQYAFMLGALAVFSWSSDDETGARRALHLCRIIVAGIYFYGGLQKLNSTFAQEVFPWFVEPFAAVMPAVVSENIVALGWTVPFVEMFIGIGLLTKKFRFVSMVLAIALCIVILVALGPWGHAYNSVVWPWNAAMVLFTLILFSRERDVSVREMFTSDRSPFAYITIALFCIMPAFSFLNRWDSYLSSALYSGNLHQGKIAVSPAVYRRLPFEHADDIAAAASAHIPVPIFAWSMQELNVPPYPAVRVYKGIARELCAYGDSADDVRWTLHIKPTIFTGGKTEEGDCGEF